MTRISKGEENTNIFYVLCCISSSQKTFLYAYWNHMFLTEDRLT